MYIGIHNSFQKKRKKVSILSIFTRNGIQCNAMSHISYLSLFLAEARGFAKEYLRICPYFGLRQGT